MQKCSLVIVSSILYYITPIRDNGTNLPMVAITHLFQPVDAGADLHGNLLPAPMKLEAHIDAVFLEFVAAEEVERHVPLYLKRLNVDLDVRYL